MFFMQEFKTGNSFIIKELRNRIGENWIIKQYRWFALKSTYINFL